MNARLPSLLSHSLRVFARFAERAEPVASFVTPFRAITNLHDAAALADLYVLREQALHLAMRTAVLWRVFGAGHFETATIIRTTAPNAVGTESNRIDATTIPIEAKKKTVLPASLSVIFFSFR